MDQRINSKSILNEHDAAKYVGLAVQTLRNKRFRGEPPIYYKISRSVRYRVEDLEKFLMKHRIDPEAA
jgi:hypothetical protein